MSPAQAEQFSDSISRLAVAFGGLRHPVWQACEAIQSIYAHLVVAALVRTLVG